MLSDLKENLNENSSITLLSLTCFHHIITILYTLYIRMCHFIFSEVSRIVLSHTLYIEHLWKTWESHTDIRTNCGAVMIKKYLVLV